jgi:DNA polymerase III delta prime subunit
MGTQETTSKTIGKIRIKSIKAIGRANVVNLTVNKNHTFITENGIITHNCDGFGQQAQRILRAEIEKYADSVRFILTANHANKIIPALHSRLQSFHFDALDMESFLNRLTEILQEEKVDYEPEDVVAFVQLAYPDMRKAINLLEQHVRGGKLYSLEDTQTSKDYLIEMATMFKNGQYTQARKLVCSQARPEDYEDIYRFMYTNLDLFSDTDAGQGMAIMSIAKGLRNHALVADPEINLAAVFVEISQINV